MITRHVAGGPAGSPSAAAALSVWSICIWRCYFSIVRCRIKDFERSRSGTRASNHAHSCLHRCLHASVVCFASSPSKISLVENHLLVLHPRIPILSVISISSGPESRPKLCTTNFESIITSCHSQAHGNCTLVRGAPSARCQTTVTV
jgi:hypothetical protein